MLAEVNAPTFELTTGNVAATGPEPDAAMSPVKAVIPPPPPAAEITPAVAVIVVPSTFTIPAVDEEPTGSVPAATAVTCPLAFAVTVARAKAPTLELTTGNVAAFEPLPGPAKMSPVSCVIPPPLAETSCQ